MMLALVVTPLVVVSELGGTSEAINAIALINTSYLDLFSTASFISIISLMAWGLGYFGQPHILVRFMSIRDENETHIAKNMGMTWMIASIVGSLSVGFFGIAYVNANGIDLADSEKIFITLSQLLFNPWIAGFLLAAILAAIMSTVDSQLLVSSSVLTRDIYHKMIRHRASDKELVWIGRVTVIAIAAIAWMISVDKNSSVLELVSYAWAGFGAAFGPVMILSLYKRDVSSSAALWGMIVGAVSVIIFKQLEGGIFDIFEIVPGFVLSWITIVGISAFSASNSKKMLEDFDTVQKRVCKKP